MTTRKRGTRTAHQTVVASTVNATLRPVPNTPIALRVPKECEHCHRTGTVRLQQTLKGDQMNLEWCCTACQHEWPVTRKEEVPANA